MGSEPLGMGCTSILGKVYEKHAYEHKYVHLAGRPQYKGMQNCS